MTSKKLRICHSDSTPERVFRRSRTARFRGRRRRAESARHRRRTALRRKAKDVFAWRYRLGIPPTGYLTSAHDGIAALPEVTCRTASIADLDRDVELLIDIFNDAWSNNWSFVPFTRAEVKKMSADFRMLIVPELTSFVSIDGEPAAIAVALPNLNEMIRDLRGRLFPTGFVRLLWRLRISRPRSARLAFIGIRKKWRHVRRYAGLSAFLFAKMEAGARAVGIEESELSWTLEDNGRINALAQAIGAERYKTYRIYERSLTPSEEAASA